MSSVACRATVNVPEEFSEVIGRCATDKFQNLSSLATFVRHFSRLNCATHTANSRSKQPQKKWAIASSRKFTKLQRGKCAVRVFWSIFPPRFTYLLQRRHFSSRWFSPPSWSSAAVRRKEISRRIRWVFVAALFFCRNSHAFCTRKLCEFRAWKLMGNFHTHFSSYSTPQQGECGGRIIDVLRKNRKILSLRFADFRRLNFHTI